MTQLTEREKQIKRDEYYMGIADAVEKGANCLGTKVGAVIVLNNRVVSTGYNGTPEGFDNCLDGGCVRCHDRWLEKQGRIEEMSDPAHRAGQALDRCVCVHAEQNAFITAARFGNAVEGATLYTTWSPCFSCLKEAVQAGVRRVVYRTWYRAEYSLDIADQYRRLYERLSEGDATRFEALGGGRPQVEEEGPPDPYAAEGGETVALEPPGS
ncbi:MAG: deoxycytidylate deaminase [Acidimicrobiia bacterium]